MKTPIKTREDLSFTKHDSDGVFIGWPRNNPGVAEDWDKGVAFFDDEVSRLASHDETEAFYAIRYAIINMGGHYTNLEIGFADRVARAAALGLRAMREGVAQFEPVEDWD